MNLRSPSPSKKELPKWLIDYQSIDENDIAITQESPQIYIKEKSSGLVGILQYIILRNNMYPFWYVPVKGTAIESDAIIIEEYNLKSEEPSLLFSLVLICLFPIIVLLFWVCLLRADLRESEQKIKKFWNGYKDEVKK